MYTKSSTPLKTKPTYNEQETKKDQDYVMNTFKNISLITKAEFKSIQMLQQIIKNQWFPISK